MLFAGKGPKRSQTGFTLLEMVIAVTLIALMAVGLWAVFRISIRSWSRGTEFMDANQRHRSILNLVRKQLASAYGVFSEFDEVTQEGRTLIFNGTETSLMFVSLNSLNFQESPGLTVVLYDVEQTEGGYSLVEREARYVGRMPGEGLGRSKPVSIFENLSSCVFEYWDPNNVESPWAREWDAQKTGKLPSAVSLTMVSHDPRGNTLNRHMVVPINSDAGGTTPLATPFGRNPLTQ